MDYASENASFSVDQMQIVKECLQFSNCLLMQERKMLNFASFSDDHFYENGSIAEINNQKEEYAASQAVKMLQKSLLYYEKQKKQKMESNSDGHQKPIKRNKFEKIIIKKQGALQIKTQNEESHQQSPKQTENEIEHKQQVSILIQDEPQIKEKIVEKPSQSIESPIKELQNSQNNDQKQKNEEKVVEAQPKIEMVILPENLESSITNPYNRQVINKPDQQQNRSKSKGKAKKVKEGQINLIHKPFVFKSTKVAQKQQEEYKAVERQIEPIEDYPESIDHYQKQLDFHENNENIEFADCEQLKNSKYKTIPLFKTQENNAKENSFMKQKEMPNILIIDKGIQSKNNKISPNSFSKSGRNRIFSDFTSLKTARQKQKVQIAKQTVNTTKQTVQEQNYTPQQVKMLLSALGNKYKEAMIKKYLKEKKKQQRQNKVNN